MFDNLVCDPTYVQEYQHEYEAYRVKVMARALLQEAQRCIWAEQSILLCVKALQWLHINAALFMGPVLEREFEQMRQQVHAVIKPLNIALDCLEGVLWGRISRTCINWATPTRVDTAADLWTIVGKLLAWSRNNVPDTTQGLFSMLCIDWLLHNPELLTADATLRHVLCLEIRKNPVFADMYARQLDGLHLPASPD